MKENILIVEDEFIVANDLSLMLQKAGFATCGIAASVQEARSMIEKLKPTWVLLDIILQGGSMGTELARYLNEKNIGFIYISANTNESILDAAKATQPYGFLVKPFREKDLLLMLEIALEKHRQNLQFIAQRQVILQKQLSALAASGTWEEALVQLPSAFQSIIPFDYLRINMEGIRMGTADEYSCIRSGFDEYQILKNQDIFSVIKTGTVTRSRFKFPERRERGTGSTTETAVNRDEWEEQLISHFALESRLVFPVTKKNGNQVLFTFYSRKKQLYSGSHLNLAVKAEAALQEVLSLHSTDSFSSCQPSGKSLPKERHTTDSTTRSFDGIIGKSPALLRVLDNISIVAASPVSVLITGESGTGKERVAQCIHKLSPRKGKPVITVNCGAIPGDLVESELFGHEKGAFTGASEKRTGKFELADGGTIFLDEIGELTLDAQVKLLRVLQEREIEHVGGSETISVDVRIIAATNKKLEKEVAEGRFRLDLFYRLNVFPIELPSLAERKEDIPILARHFLEKYSRELSKEVNLISRDAMKQLISYPWPGNIRELEHTIERSLLMTNGNVLEIVYMPGSALAKDLMETRDLVMKTLEQVEADHILSVLRNCNGKVCGTGGAAETLGLPPSTLNSKIKKLGIRREAYFNH